MNPFLPILSSVLVLSTLVSAEPTLEQLPKKVVPSPPITENVPLDAKVLELSISRGVDFLLKTQNADGSWGGATRTKGLNIYAPIPGAHNAFRMGSTALTLSGLISTKDSRPEVKAAIDRCEAWFVKALPKVKRPDKSTIYNNWGHAYGLRALVSLVQRDGVTDEKKALYKKLAESQIKALWSYQDVDGGWGYYAKNSVTARPNGGSTSFTTATVLCAMKEASEEFELELNERKVQNALRSIRYQQTPDFCYTYAMGHRWRPRYSINRPGGSLARTTACNGALREFGDKKITDDVLIMGLDRLIKRNGWLDIGRKRPKPHSTHFKVSGYFYFYGHYYASENIIQLPKEKQAEWKSKLAKVILDKQESDGSWWDYPLYNYGQFYGSGYALTTLTRCRL